MELSCRIIVDIADRHIIESLEWLENQPWEYRQEPKEDGNGQGSTSDIVYLWCYCWCHYHCRLATVPPYSIIPRHIQSVHYTFIPIIAPENNL